MVFIRIIVMKLIMITYSSLNSNNTNNNNGNSGTNDDDIIKRMTMEGSD